MNATGTISEQGSGKIWFTMFLIFGMESDLSFNAHFKSLLWPPEMDCLISILKTLHAPFIKWLPHYFMLLFSFHADIIANPKANCL